MSLNISSLGAVTRLIIGEPATVESVAEALTAAGVQGATLTPAVGLWRGGRENSVVVDIATIDVESAVNVAEYLRAEFNQESVYIERDGMARLVNRPAGYKVGDPHPTSA